MVTILSNILAQNKYKCVLGSEGGDVVNFTNNDRYNKSCQYDSIVPGVASLDVIDGKNIPKSKDNSDKNIS